MAGGVGPDRAEPDDLAAVVMFLKQVEGIVEGAGRPGRVRMEPAPLIEQDALRAFEDDRA